MLKIIISNLLNQIISKHDTKTKEQRNCTSREFKFIEKS